MSDIPQSTDAIHTGELCDRLRLGQGCRCDDCREVHNAKSRVTKERLRRPSSDACDAQSDAGQPSNRHQAHELALRAELHRRGLRFRKDYRIDLSDLRPRPDVVFTRAKVAVFLDGCFWHSFPKPLARASEQSGLLVTEAGP